MILFLALMGYLVYFNVVRAKTVVNNPHNERQDNFAEQIVRGAITDRNGNVLAETQWAEDGSEYRVYPYGDIFAHVVGYSNPELGKTGAGVSRELPSSDIQCVFSGKAEK